MKRKLVIVGDMRFMMKDVFELNDHDVDEVKRYMERDFIDIHDVIKKAAKSDLTLRQKMLVSYIAGNTYGVMQARDMGDMIKGDKNVPPIGG